MIPQHIRHLKFLKVLPNSKRAFEKDWQTTPDTWISCDEADKWLAAGNNIGVICGPITGVGMIDADHIEYVLAVENLLPPTFSVRSSSDKKRHFYYKIINFPAHVNKVSLVDYDDPKNTGKQGGDIRFGNFYVVGPGSVHPETKARYTVVDDVPIAEVDFNKITEVLGTYFSTSIVESPMKRKHHNFALPITKLLEHYKIQMKGHGAELFCPHPVHGSDNGTNFGVNVDKNVWCCRRHNVGGSPLHLIAVMEKWVECAAVSDGIIPDIHKKAMEFIARHFGEDYAVDWDKTNNGQLRGTFNNALTYIEHHDLDICLNEFSNTIEYNGLKYSDRMTVILKEQMREMKLEPSIATIEEAVTAFALKNNYHPVREWLSKLEWDGHPRVNTWLSESCGADRNEYTEFVARTALLAPVYRVFRPGIKYDTMIIFEGNQGIGKSRLVQAMSGPWYKFISLTDKDKDSIQQMEGGWIIEVPELSVFTKRDIESLKAFLSNGVDEARFAYHRHVTTVPRQNVFIGTTNPESNGYLMDTTGNRRFLPISLPTINVDQFLSNRDQLFAEAMTMFKKNIPIYVTQDDLGRLVAAEQKKREYHDDWATAIVNYVNGNHLDMAMHMTCMQIWVNVLSGRAEVYDKRQSLRIGNILRRLGCNCEDTHINGISGKFYDLSPLKIKPKNEEIPPIQWEE